MVESAHGGASLPGGFLPSASARPIDANTAVAVFFGAWIAGQLVAAIVLSALHGVDTSTDPTFTVTATALVGAWSVHLAAMWLASQRSGSGDVVTDYGIRIRPVDAFGLAIGALCSLVLIRVVYLPLEAIWPDTFSEERLTENAENLVARAEGSTWLVVLLVVVGAPVVEELLYRGLLQRSLAARYREGLVVVVVAALFALVHFRPVEIPGLFAIGIVFGVAALWTRRLGMPIAVHAGFNAVGIIQAL